MHRHFKIIIRWAKNCSNGQQWHNNFYPKMESEKEKRKKGMYLLYSYQWLLFLIYTQIPLLFSTMSTCEINVRHNLDVPVRLFITRWGSLNQGDRCSNQVVQLMLLEEKDTCHSWSRRHTRKSIIMTKQKSLPAHAPQDRYLDI